MPQKLHVLFFDAMDWLFLRIVVVVVCRRQGSRQSERYGFSFLISDILVVCLCVSNGKIDSIQNYHTENYYCLTTKTKCITQFMPNVSLYLDGIVGLRRVEIAVIYLAVNGRLNGFLFIATGIEFWFGGITTMCVFCFVWLQYLNLSQRLFIVD